MNYCQFIFISYLCKRERESEVTGDIIVCLIIQKNLSDV